MKFIKANFSAMKKKLAYAIAAICLMLSPVASFCQVDPGGAGNPDAVPFDSNMNLIFLAVGVLLAGFVMIRKFKKTLVKA